MAYTPVEVNGAVSSGTRVLKPLLFMFTQQDPKCLKQEVLLISYEDLL